MHKSMLLVSLGILVVAQVVQGRTVYANDPPRSCEIIGDTDIYGIGIRLSFYLQWGATLVALLFDLGEEARGLRVSSNIITISVLTNVFLGISSGSILILELIIVVNLVVLLSLNFSGLFSKVDNTSVETGIKLLLMTLLSALLPWIIFKAYYDGLKPGCTLYVTAFPKYDWTNHGYLEFCRAGACLAVLSCICFGPVSLLHLSKGIK
jgi:hypothetical protein